MHPRVLEVTDRLIARSRATREPYLAMIRAAASEGPQRGKLQCANFAHGVAGCGSEDKQALRLMNAANVDRKSTRLNSSHSQISHAVFCLKKTFVVFSISTITRIRGRIKNPRYLAIIY